MSTFTATGAWGTFKASGLHSVACHAASSGGSLQRPVAFGRSSRLSQGHSYSLNKRSPIHRGAPTQFPITKLGKRAAGSGSWKKAARQNAVTASVSVPPHITPMLDYVLVLTKGGEEEARQEINRAGGHIVHWFGDTVLVATLPQGFDVHSLTSASLLPDNYEGNSATLSLIQSWSNSKAIDASSNQNDGKFWDAPGKTPPGGLLKAQSPSPALDAMISFVKIGKKYLSGRIGLVCIVVSGPVGSGAAGGELTKDQVEKAWDQIKRGARFWTDAEPLAGIEFDHRPDRWVTLQVANDIAKLPGVDPTVFENKFRDLALKQLADQDTAANAAARPVPLPPVTYDSIDDFLGKTFPGTDTVGYCVFVTSYNLAHYAYVPYIGTTGISGNTVFMEYTNGHWGPDSLGQTFAHETGHIFGASDEYTSNCDCEVNNASVVPVINGNCQSCSPTPKICIMKNHSLGWICPFTRGQLGWEWWGYSSPLDSLTDNDKTLTTTSPALAADGTTLYLAWKPVGSNTVRIKSSTDQGVTWTAFQGPPFAEGSGLFAATGPRLAVFNGLLYLAFVSTKGKSDPTEKLIKVMCSRPGTAVWQDVSPGYPKLSPGSDFTKVCARSDFAPSLAVFNDSLYMAFRDAAGSNHIRILSISKASGATWSDPRAGTIVPNSDSRYAPALCTLPGTPPQLFLAYQAFADESIYVRTSRDGRNFSSGTLATAEHARNSGPALSALGNGRMYLVFAATKYGGKFPVADGIGNDEMTLPVLPEQVNDREGPMMYLSSKADNIWTPPRFLPEGNAGNRDSCTDQTPSLAEILPTSAAKPGGLLMIFKGEGNVSLRKTLLGRPVAY